MSVTSPATTSQFPSCCNFIFSWLKNLPFTLLSGLYSLQIYHLPSVSMVLSPGCTVYSRVIKPASLGAAQAAVCFKSFFGYTESHKPETHRFVCGAGSLWCPFLPPLHSPTSTSLGMCRFLRAQFF